MEYFDVMFPLNLGPLTYRVPEGSAEGAIVPGMMVEAEIKKSLKRGIVLRPSPALKGEAVKRISSVVGEGPVLGGEMLRLLSWMSGYYYANEGSVLKCAFPREFFERVKPRGKAEGVKCPPSAFGLDERSREWVEAIHGAMEAKSYEGFLLHAPSVGYELSFLLKALEGAGNAIILVPDHSEADLLEGAVREKVGERLAVYHGGMSRGRRSEALRRIVAGEGDVVLGNLSAVFAPLKDVSLIVVLQEESALYKAESGVRYNARDVAVMRGFLSGAAVLLSSICPSVESMHNVRQKKYSLLDAASGARRPRVRVINMWKSRSSPVSSKLRKAAGAALERGERALVYVNRRGHSILYCEDCGHVEDCPRCGIPLVYYKAQRKLICNYCGRQAAAFDVCPRCGGSGLKPAGAGLERVEEELAPLGPVGFESRSKGNLRLLMEDGGLAVGTKYLTMKTELSGGFSVAGVVDADAHRFFPDFRATERAFQEFCYVADRLAPGGQLILQSRHPGDRLFSYLRRFSFKRFYDEELKERKDLGYPPFSRMALVSASCAGEPKVPYIKGVEALGPVLSLAKGGRRLWKVIFKAPSRRELQQAVSSLLRNLGGCKVAVDVDPTSV